MISVPVMSAGIRSGVNWMRLNERFSARESVLIISVLASPGTPSSRQWLAAEERDQQLFDHLVLADDHLRELLQDFFACFVELANGGRIGTNGGCVHLQFLNQSYWLRPTRSRSP